MGAKYLLSLAIVIGCYVNARRRGAGQAVFAFLAPIALGLGSIGFTTVRAQMFTLLFLVLLLLFLQEDYRGRRWWVWFWLPLVIVWTNLHAGVLVGIGMLAIYGTGRFLEAWRGNGTILGALRDTRHLLLIGATSLATLNLSPYGWDYVPYLIRAVRMERPLIQEWAPIWQDGDRTLISVFIISVLIAMCGVWRFRNERLFEPLALVVSAWLAASHMRHLSIYAVVWICLVPPMIQPAPLGEAMQRCWRNLAGWLVLIWACIGVGSVGYAFQNQFWKLQIPTDPAYAKAGSPIYPVGAVEYLRSHEFKGNLMVPFNVGAFISWHLYPDVKVSNDSRYDVAYPEGIVEEIVALYQGRAGWQATLEKYPPDAILVPRGLPLEGLLRIRGADQSGKDWKNVYQDAGYALFVDPVRFPSLPVVDRSSEIIKGAFP